MVAPWCSVQSCVSLRSNSDSSSNTSQLAPQRALGGLHVSKLHSFLIQILFLNIGLLACGHTDSSTAQPFRVRWDASAVTESDARVTHDAAPARGDAAASDSGDNEPLRADAGKIGAPVRDAAPSDPDDNEAGAVSQTDASAAPGTFSHIYEGAFWSCRSRCHVMGYSMLNMATREAAYAALVDQDSNPRNVECAPLGLKRVKPGDPDQSLLYLKLAILPPCGQQMPPGGLIRAELREEVRQWILNGAKDD
jgi:hypothetical protein